MKINAGLFSLALAGFSTLAAAQPHGKHARLHGRHADRNVVTKVDVVWTTVDDDYKPSTPTPTFSQKVKNPAVSVPSPSGAPVSSTAPAAPSSTSKKEDKTQDTGNGNTNQGVDSNSGTSREFKDGVIPCSTFPSDYGAVPLPWFTKGGWSGIQYNGGNIDSEGICKEGALCSYACPAGYSKSQWPTDQPASGESHGGLLCKNGFLTRTRTDFKYLCEGGAGGITVKNELDSVVAVCRTDYPGTENMVIPLQCDAGSEKDLATPDADQPGAYKWKGGNTSAQYYVNNAGVSVKDGCLWGKPGSEVGNYSPYIFGSGKSKGKIWISVSKNPNNSKPANFNVSIVGGTGPKCECIMGVCKDGGAGCTIAVDPGQKAYFRLWK